MTSLQTALETQKESSAIQSTRKGLSEQSLLATCYLLLACSPTVLLQMFKSCNHLTEPGLCSFAVSEVHALRATVDKLLEVSCAQQQAVDRAAIAAVNSASKEAAGHSPRIANQVILTLRLVSLPETNQQPPHFPLLLPLVVENVRVCHVMRTPRRDSSLTSCYVGSSNCELRNCAQSSRQFVRKIAS